MFRNVLLKFSRLNNKNNFCTVVSKKKRISKRLDKLEYSVDDESKILDVLNNKMNDELLRLKIPTNQINKLESWRNKKGTFRNLTDVIDAEGMDVKCLAKIFHSIVIDSPFHSIKKVENKRQIISPVPTDDTLKSLGTVVGLSQGPSGISWVEISCLDRNIISWDLKTCNGINNKTSPQEIFDLTTNVRDELPAGDLYVTESLPKMSSQPNVQIGILLNHLEQVQFNSMMLVLLNTSRLHNKNIIAKSKESYPNIVYYMKPNITARLFRTLVGNEKVSSISVVNQIFNNEGVQPCEPITIDPNIRKSFDDRSPVDKELMSQSLLLVITFLELCYYKNPVSLKALYRRN